MSLVTNRGSTFTQSTDLNNSCVHSMLSEFFFKEEECKFKLLKEH